MRDALELLQENRLAAIVQAPQRQALIARAVAAARGGIELLILPATIPDMTEIAAEISDRTDLTVGLSEVVEQEHLNIALAAGIELVISPVFDQDLIFACRQRGIGVIPSVATPTELLWASRAHEGPIGIFPAGILGGPGYVEKIASVRPSVRVVAMGGVGPDNGPQYLEAGASAIIVDCGLFPADNDPASIEVITVRAGALVEVCADIVPGERASRV